MQHGVNRCARELAWLGWLEAIASWWAAAISQSPFPSGRSRTFHCAAAPRWRTIGA